MQAMQVHSAVPVAVQRPAGNHSHQHGSSLGSWEPRLHSAAHQAGSPTCSLNHSHWHAALQQKHQWQQVARVMWLQVPAAALFAAALVLLCSASSPNSPTVACQEGDAAAAR
jgi:hypothetical protein